MIAVNGKLTFEYGWQGAHGVQAAITACKTQRSTHVEELVVASPAGEIFGVLRFGITHQGKVRAVGEQGRLGGPGSHTLSDLRHGEGVVAADLVLRLARYMGDGRELYRVQK